MTSMSLSRHVEWIELPYDLLPTGEEVGDYYVWYYVKGDAFHLDSEAAYVIAHIAKKPNLTITAIDQTYTYNGKT